MAFLRHILHAARCDDYRFAQQCIHRMQQCVAVRAVHGRGKIRAQHYRLSHVVQREIRRGGFSAHFQAIQLPLELAGRG